MSLDLHAIDLLLLLILAVTAVSGWRRGFAVVVLGYTGLLAGLALGAWAAARVGLFITAEDSLRRLLVGIVVFFLVAVACHTIGTHFGVRLRSAITGRVSGNLDAAGGAVVAAGVTAVALWFVALTLGSVPFSPLARALTDSRVLRTIDRFAPRPPAALSQIRGLLARSPFPDAFADMRPPRAAGACRQRLPGRGPPGGHQRPRGRGHRPSPRDHLEWRPLGRQGRLVRPETGPCPARRARPDARAPAAGRHDALGHHRRGDRLPRRRPRVGGRRAGRGQDRGGRARHLLVVAGPARDLRAPRQGPQGRQRGAGGGPLRPPRRGGVRRLHGGPERGLRAHQQRAADGPGPGRLAPLRGGRRGVRGMSRARRGRQFAPSGRTATSEGYCAARQPRSEQP